MNKIFYICCAVVMGLTYVSGLSAEEKIYVGSEVCKECHEQQYNNFMESAKKARSFDSIKKMEKKLSPEEYQACFECHTTGYRKKSGFVSEEKTPELKNPGCEVCHGPGSLHAASGDPGEIVRKVTMENCNTCHSKDRIEAFDFKPLLFGGAH
ncbi:MAG: cytochrome c family protein [Proteobacteria bacterium]|nr:cytochrome c family protein [Pseudomonadota bacterium]